MAQVHDDYTRLKETIEQLKKKQLKKWRLVFWMKE